MPKIEAGDSQTLFLTNIRSSQQESVKTAIYESKVKMRGKSFSTKASPPKFCQSNRIAYITTGSDGKKRVNYSYVPCNSWRCPDCQLFKALRVKYVLHDVILLNNLTHFLTLTLDPKKIPSEYENDTHTYITKLFNHFRTIISRSTFAYTPKKSKKEYVIDLSKKDEKLRYVWVVEYQQNGNAHLHILLNYYLPIQVIRKVWTHVGGGHIMRVEKVKSKNGIAHYISDYIVKGIKQNSSSSNSFKFFQKRYSISRSCIRLPRRKAVNYNKLPGDTDKTLHLEKDQLDVIYNTLQSNIYPEKEVIL